MKSQFTLSLAILALFFVSCSVKPQPIVFGEDACHYCKMNIVDKLHASEFVTQKGKVFKFDAIECMVQELKNKKEENIAITLVSDYNQPGQLIEAKTATFLVSEAIPSPMGANLSAFQINEDAVNIRNEKGGEVMDWSKLLLKEEVVMQVLNH